MAVDPVDSSQIPYSIFFLEDSREIFHIQYSFAL